MAGSIPAPAGEPTPSTRSGPARGVYPRACGGTSYERWNRHREGGLSPRLRGNRAWSCASTPSMRSIPAPAGEPSGVRCPLSTYAVYPRACGGTTALSVASGDHKGLSPRLRGNHCPQRCQWRPQRSIPAPAGEPLHVGQVLANLGVYPRACGGTRGPRRPATP